jgi:hypothetical protein
MKRAVITKVLVLATVTLALGAGTALAATGVSWQQAHQYARGAARQLPVPARYIARVKISWCTRENGSVVFCGVEADGPKNRFGLSSWCISTIKVYQRYGRILTQRGSVSCMRG